jgi:[ribosomal protein S5]-alanine N-acetyltransferase
LIETQRLSIRLPEAADVPRIIDYYRENLEYLRPYSPAFEPGMFDEAAWHEQIGQRRRELSYGESLRAFIFARDGANTILGNINLTQVFRGAFQSSVLGYNLAEAAQGHGYMTEAVLGVVGFAFGQWGLHRVAANYMPRNERSAAVLKRCGFRVEGLAPAYLLINGRWEDHVLTAITNEDWQAQRRIHA